LPLPSKHGVVSNPGGGRTAAGTQTYLGVTHVPSCLVGVWKKTEQKA